MRFKKHTLPTALVLTMMSACGASKHHAVDASKTENTASIGHFEETDLNQKLAEGLAIWRQQRKDINGINKGACANCHSADGIELALWDFQDDDVRRRAHIDGVAAEESEKLVAYFAALRQKYKIQKLKSRLDDRPFQPQGRPLPGSTKTERDYAFAVKSLRELSPTLVDQTIETLGQAIKAKEELKASNLQNVQIGIALPRLSEDCFHGSEHCSMNDWIADLPRIPKPEFEVQWYELNDRYISNPTPDNLREVLNAVETMTSSWRNPDETKIGPAGSLGTYKFRSVQILQHFLRREQLGLTDSPQVTYPMASIIGPGQKRPNAPFLVGDFSFNKDSAPWTEPASMPIFVRTSLGESATRTLTKADVESQKMQMSQPWWYTGLILDPNLSTGTGSEYFLGSLGRDPTGGYPFHRFYAIAKHGTFSNDRRAEPDQVEANNVALAKIAWKDVGDDDLPRLFDSLEARQLYRHLETNWTVMWMLLAKEQLEKSGLGSFDSYFDVSLNFCAPSGSVSLRQWVTRVSSFEGQRAAALFELYNSVNTLAKCGLNPLPAQYVSGNGTGLTIDWYKGSGDEFNGKSSFLLNSPKLATHIEAIVDFPGRENGDGYFAKWARTAGVKIGEDEDEDTAYSSRGSGFVLAPVTGDYEFILNDNGGGFGRITVNNQEVYAQFRYNEQSPLRVKVALQAGQRYPIVFERHGFAAGGIRLEWVSTNGNLPRQKIPGSQLYPN